MIACPEFFSGAFGGTGNSDIHEAAVGDYWDPLEPDCTRYLYAWAAVRDTDALTEEQWEDGMGWPSTYFVGYVLSPILYDEETVVGLIDRIYDEITDTEDYTIYEVHFFGRQQTLDGDPETEPDWWTSLYYEPTEFKYQPWTFEDTHPEYVPHTMLENANRGNLD